MQVRPRLSWRGAALVVAVGLLLPLAGGSAALAAPRAKAATSRKAVPASTRKGTIRIGVLGSERGSRGQAIPSETQQIAEAWADMQNATGGINGYRFRVLYRNVDSN